MIYPFPGAAAPLNIVGGKGRSLILMAAQDLPVPPGCVLGVEFFEPWWEDGLTQAAARERRFTPEQREALLGCGLEGDLFAVRSSSPEEDLAGSSFAGIYETILGVTRDGLEEAVARAFASCLDERVTAYKQAQGYADAPPRIAVVIQQQIASETAGVGFSLNPISNDYDEAVINANFGLGETVVAGLATPDTYRVDRVRQVIVERQKGAKETSIFLLSQGGTEERPSPFREELALTDAQVLEVAALITRVADFYASVIDIEWAYADARLYLLQARPVTTHLQLPPGMLTEFGAPRRLYADITISVQGLLRPLSVMGTSCLRQLLKAVTEHVFGRDLADPDGSFLVTAVAGRIYFNLSNLFMLVSRERFCSFFANLDPVTAELVAGAGLEESGDPHLKDVRLEMLWHIPDKLLHVVEARLMPESAYQRTQAKLAEYLRTLQTRSREPWPVLLENVFPELARLIFVQLIPLVGVSQAARLRLNGLFPPGHEADLDSLTRALPGNVTVEMGRELERLARQLPEGTTVEDLLAGRNLPEGWPAFLEKYGHRGPLELDVRSPRFREHPRMLLEQLVQLRAAPPAGHEQAGEEQRRAAAARLGEAIKSQGWLRTQGFLSLYKVWERLGGLRETPKFYVIATLDMLRSRLLAEGRKLAEEGRLDTSEQIFDLTLDDLVAGEMLDLRERREERLVAQASFERCRDLPRLLDSRGRRYTPPPRSTRPGEVAGIPISAGVARGPVKALHAPDEKPVLPGDILVARATDPGWTPLFVNVGAVVLEVGGMLQHGALVAREYGKPCVAGVAGAVELWEDGTMVEVDGTTGIIRRL